MKHLLKLRCFFGFHTYEIRHVKEERTRAYDTYFVSVPHICCKYCSHIFAKDETID